MSSAKSEYIRLTEINHISEIKYRKQNLKHNTIYNCSKESEIDIHLTKHVQDLYAENYKMLIKAIKEDLNKWKAIPLLGYSMDWKTQNSEMSILPQID